MLHPFAIFFPFSADSHWLKFCWSSTTSRFQVLTAFDQNIFLASIAEIIRSVTQDQTVIECFLLYRWEIFIWRPGARLLNFAAGPQQVSLPLC